MADDNCGIQSVQILNIDSLSCSDYGLNQVQLLITDVNGNLSDTLLAFINVQLTASMLIIHESKEYVQATQPFYPKWKQCCLLPMAMGKKRI